MITGVFEVHNEGNTVVVENIRFAEIAMGNTKMMDISKPIH